MGERAVVAVKQVELTNFRCFSHYTLDLTAPYVYIEGVNGIGKTTILEALYYACYLRSFRTHIPKELISFGKSEFFIKVALYDQLMGMDHTVQIGFSPTRRLVKVDQKTIGSYKELLAYYRIISVTEDDLQLVQSAPHIRRLALDQCLILLDPEIAHLLRTYKHTVEQRNALLQQRSFGRDLYNVLTRQLWNYAQQIMNRRKILLADLAIQMNELGSQFLPGFSTIQLAYQPKRELLDSYEQFEKDEGERLYQQELRLGRTLFGPHLDDMVITFQGNHSRLYASRGQQKMLVMLFKMAQLRILMGVGLPAICLLDDFMTDFDPDRASQLIEGLSALGSQLIFTSPISGGFLGTYLQERGGQVARLTL